MVFAIDEDLDTSPFISILDTVLKRIGGEIERHDTSSITTSLQNISLYISTITNKLEYPYFERNLIERWTLSLLEDITPKDITEWSDNIFNESLKHLPCSVADDNISCEVDVLSSSNLLKVSNFFISPDQRILYVSCPDSKYVKIIIDYINHPFTQNKETELYAQIVEPIAKEERSLPIPIPFSYSPLSPLVPTRKSRPINVPKSKRDSIELAISPHSPSGKGHLSTSPFSDIVKSPFVGSFQESLLSGHMSTTKSSVFSGFSVNISVSSGKGIPKHIKIPFDALYYHLEDSNHTPYVGAVVLPKERFKIPKIGTLQVTIFNPSKTPIKTYLVKYDLNDMPPNSRTFLRQITRTVAVPPILQYAIHFNIVCSKNSRVYLYKNLRVVFPHRKPDELDSLEVFNQLPNDPQFYPYP